MNIGRLTSRQRDLSVCPSSEEAALDLVMSLPEEVAAKDAKGNQHIGKASTGGTRQYTKMIHNCIEHSMTRDLAEAWQIMSLCLIDEFYALE